MSKLFKIVAFTVVLVAVCAAYFYYPIYVGQKRFHDAKSKIEIGMKRADVLALAKEIGYFEYVAGRKQIELDGKKFNVNEDVYSYNNLMLPSVLIIEYNQNGLVVSIGVDQ